MRAIQAFLFYSAVTLGLIAATAAQAELSTIFQKGAWSVDYGTATDGKLACVLKERGSTGMFTVKYFDGGKMLVIQLFKLGWQIPSGTKARVVMQFDQATPWTAMATGFTLNANVGYLEFRLGSSSEEVDTFMNEFRFSRQVVLSFPDGAETPWQGSMAGSDAAMQAFARCVANIHMQHTQPFGTSRQQTQPFSAPQPSNQPFTPPPHSAEPRRPEITL